MNIAMITPHANPAGFCRLDEALDLVKVPWEPPRVPWWWPIIMSSSQQRCCPYL